jgi:hypothetical protein
MFIDMGVRGLFGPFTQAVGEIVLKLATSEKIIDHQTRPESSAAYVGNRS